MLLSVGAVYSDLTAGKPEDCLLDVKIVAATDKPFRCFGDVLIEPNTALDNVGTTDVAVVCDIYAPIDTPPRDRYQCEIAWLKRMFADGSIVASVCSGSLIAAEAGLLDGKECAGHWAYRDLFREHYPKVRFREEAILVFAGEDARIITAGGHSSWHDLTLHLIARLCGKNHALRTASDRIGTLIVPRDPFLALANDRIALLDTPGHGGKGQLAVQVTREEVDLGRPTAGSSTEF